MIYTFILRQQRSCEVGIQSEKVRIYISSVVGSFLRNCATAKGHTRVSWPVCLSDQQVSPFAWVTSRSLPSVQNYRSYIVFSSPMREYEPPPSSPTYFLFIAGYRNLCTSVFFFGNLLILSANLNICHSIQRQQMIFFAIILYFLFFQWNYFVDAILLWHWIWYVHPRSQLCQYITIVIHRNSYNHLTVCQKCPKACFKMLSTNCVYKSYISNICVYKQDFVLNDLHWLICHKTKPNQTQAKSSQKDKSGV